MFIEMIVVIEMFFIVRHSLAAGQMKVEWKEEEGG